MREIHLTWAGPYSLRTPAERERFNPPHAPGVYIWTVGPHRAISYVGQAANIHARQYQHIHSTLGGAYWLYAEEYFDGERGWEPSKEYRPTPASLNRRYLDEFERLSKLAFHSLTNQEMYWAEVEGGKVIREHVESALIAWARGQEPLVVQNGAVSRSADPGEPLLIRSAFEGTPPRNFPLAVSWPFA